MEVPQKGKPVTSSHSAFRSKFVYRCKEASPRRAGAVATSQRCRAITRPLRAAVGSRGGHADLGAISNPATDPGFNKAGRWTRLYLAPPPSRSASCGQAQAGFVRAYLLLSASPPGRTTDASYPAEPIKPLQGPSRHFSVTCESVQCSGRPSTPSTATAPTVTA